MKKLFISTVFIFIISLVASAQCGSSGEYLQTDTRTLNNCNVSFNFLGLTKHTGSITTTTTYKNQLTGLTCQTTSSTGCGVGGGSWDWPWE